VGFRGGFVGIAVCKSGMNTAPREAKTVRNNRKLERRPARLGAMAERVTSDTPSYQRILRRFGIVDKEQPLSTADAWSTFLHVQQRTGILNSYIETEAALCKFSDEDILRLRGRLLARYSM
jgi:hypothetical protein